ncbi:NmrA family NAD(P)-binding protein [Staphylococcus sp. GDX8P80P]|uniref:NmrA family NAD(P)-binding protein n=1 Tax=Staphylococcus sp. GDX8P80P TaxID=2804104 RepID=UPI001AEC3949|nr:NmrA family NAD(P)-binding protein [Staphylococcus sp. GDX8P80P]
MNKEELILVTGAGGEVGSLSNIVIEKLLNKGFRVRAFMHSGNARIDDIKKLGAEVFEGDLLNLSDVVHALKGVSRVYFSMSLSPYYSDAAIIMSSACKQNGNIKAFVNISQYEMTYMNFNKMALPEKERQAWLGGFVKDWSPQERAHWVTEQALNWSDLPVINVHAAIFIENPILTWLPLKEVLETGKLRLPFNNQKFAPIAGYDVAEVIANILEAPEEHVNQSYTINGPKLIGGDDIAEAYSTVLNHDVTYESIDLESWSKHYISEVHQSRNAHTAVHLETLGRLVASGRNNNEGTEQLTQLLQREPVDLEYALAHSPKIKEVLTRMSNS